MRDDISHRSLVIVFGINNCYSITPLLIFLESQVKQLMVIGSTTRAKEILDWVSIVSSRLIPAESIDADPSPSIVARRNALLKAVSTRSRSVVNRLRALANVDRVSELNSQRQADFLRGVTTTSQGKALARRAAKVCTFSSLCMIVYFFFLFVRIRWIK